jgi:hypothetical protein
MHFSANIAKSHDRIDALAGLRGCWWMGGDRTYYGNQVLSFPAGGSLPRKATRIGDRYGNPASADDQGTASGVS